MARYRLGMLAVALLSTLSFTGAQERPVVCWGERPGAFHGICMG